MPELMTHRVFRRPGVIARTAGILYLAEMIAGAASLYALAGIVVAGDAAATAVNVRLHEGRFVLSFAADVAQFACYLGVTALLYWLLRPVNPIVSLVAAFFSLTGCVVGAVSCVFQIAPLIVARNPAFLRVFTDEQRDALAFLLHRLYSQSFETTFVFFGAYCVLVGYLVFRSRFAPKWLGAVMTMSGLLWLLFLWPPLGESLFQFVALAAIGELTFALWLSIRGVDEAAWASPPRAAAAAR